MTQSDDDENKKIKFPQTLPDYESEINRIINLIKEKKTDNERWQKHFTTSYNWEKRTKIIGKMIPENSKILDLGCGNCLLKSFIPNNCEYTGADIVKRNPETILIEINENIWPTGHWDIIVAAGLLEYIYDIEGFFEKLSTLANRTIISYHISKKTDESTTTKRLENGWLSNYDNNRIVKAFTQSGWSINSITGQARKEYFRQYIYDLEKP